MTIFKQNKNDTTIEILVSNDLNILVLVNGEESGLTSFKLKQYIRGALPPSKVFKQKVENKTLRLNMSETRREEIINIIEEIKYVKELAA